MRRATKQMNLNKWETENNLETAKKNVKQRKLDKPRNRNCYRVVCQAPGSALGGRVVMITRTGKLSLDRSLTWRQGDRGVGGRRDELVLRD